MAHYAAHHVLRRDIILLNLSRPQGIVGSAPGANKDFRKTKSPERSGLFRFMLTSIVLQAQNPPGSLGNLRDSGHHPGPDELACETCSPVSRGNLLSRIGTYGISL